MAQVLIGFESCRDEQQAEAHSQRVAYPASPGNTIKTRALALPACLYQRTIVNRINSRYFVGK
jgi:hypothetical protein